MSLSLTNITLILAYLVVLLLIGWRSARHKEHDNFLIANRDVDTFSAIATINASKTGSIVILYTALIYAYGASAIWYFIGMSLGYLLFLPFALKLFKMSDKRYYTLSDYYFYNFGKSAAQSASLVCIMTMFGLMVLNLIAATKVFEYFSGLSYSLAALIVSSVVLVYLSLAGFKAVVSTDNFQYLAILFILFLFCILLYDDVSIPAADLDLSKAGLKTIVGFFILGIFLPFAQPDLWQRVYAVKSERVLKRSILISVLIHFLVAIALSLIALSIKFKLPDLNPDIAMIEGFARLLPQELAGLVVIVFFSAMMSSIDTYAYTTSSCIVQDFCKTPSLSTAVRRIRYCLILVIASGTVLSIYYGNLVKFAFLLSGFFMIIAVPTVYTWLRPNTDHRVINLVMPVNLFLLLILLSYELLTGSLNPTIMLKAFLLSLLSICLVTTFLRVKCLCK